MITTKVELLDLMSQLGRETVVEYLAESKTIDAIVDDLLAMQILTPAITKGTISNSIKDLTRSIQVDGDTILRALMRLRDTVGGYIEVDNDRELNWLDSIGEDKGQQIRYRKNLKGIERDMDYSSLVNRLYAYGASEGEARIELTAPGYVEDEASQTEWGGIYVGTKVDRSITHPDTLLAWANLKLAETKNPIIAYRVDTVDLSKSEEIDFSFEALQLGSKIKVIDEKLGIDVETTVVKIEHPDLLHPEQMTLELANRTKDITDTLSEVYDSQQLRDHIATKIGAGQVIVLGEFSVIDWVSAGTTYIKGGYIRTGLLESTNWGAGAGSQFNLDDGTFKLGGSSSPKLSWNGTVLSIQGHIVATSGEFTGTLKTSNIEAGKTLTINGAINAGGGNVIIDSGGVKVTGAGRLTFYHGATPWGYISSYLGSLTIDAQQEDLRLASKKDIELRPDTTLVRCRADFRPDTTNAYDLGSSSKKWQDLYAVTVHEGDTVFANDWRLTETKDNKGMQLLRPDGSVAQEWR